MKNEFEIWKSFAQAHEENYNQILGRIEVEIWKSRAQAHEENYNQMLGRIDELSAENKLWREEAKRWRDMYLEYDEMLDADLERAKARISNVIRKIKSLEKEIND